MLSNLRRRINNSVNALLHPEYSQRMDTLPPRKLRAALTLPWVREKMVAFSNYEYLRNPYYGSVINKQSEQTIGPCPTIIATSESASDNDMMEDSHQDWTQLNSIGKSLREFRRQAGKTGLGLMIPTKIKTDHPVKLGYKVYGADALKNPRGININDRIIDGIEYNENWDPIKFHFKNTDQLHEGGHLRNLHEDTVPFDVGDVIWWSRGYENGRIDPVPECVAAFTVYPFIRRYLQASIEAAEFRTSFPMALELDPTMYGKNELMQLQQLEKFEYQPRTVPTLPVGTSLKGLPSGASADQSDKMLRTMAAACALCIDMPANLALGDSSDSNMASAQVDIQPWKNHVNIDRFDLIPCMRRTFHHWYDRASLIRGLTPESSRPGNEFADWFPHVYVYDGLFQHPDPLKNANARAVDMAGGSTTLNQVYASQGLNARRQIEREAKLFGIPYDKMCEIILATRSNLSIQILSGEPEIDDEPIQAKR